MTDNDRNHHIGELAERFFAFKWPNASRKLRELDEGSQRSCYGLAGLAVSYFEEVLAHERHPSLGTPGSGHAGSAEESAQSVPPTKAVCQPSEDDEPDLRVEDVLAGPDDEIDSDIPF